MWKPSSLEGIVDSMVTWIKQHFGEGRTPSGIVYCLTRKDTEAVAERMNVAGILCANYHADIDPMQRQRTHELWRMGEIDVIVATIAFGMGELYWYSPCHISVLHSLH